mgnify:CR=1 FL=1
MTHTTQERYERPLIMRRELGSLTKQWDGGGPGAPPIAVGEAVDGVSAQSLKTKYGSPLYVVSEATLRKNLRGFLSAFRSRYPETVVAYSGDGGAFDIGLGGLSGIAERNANVLVIVNDNQGYQNTGGQQSGGTPRGIITKSTQPFNQAPPAARNRKDLLEILAAHRVPYLATASAAFPRDLDQKVRKALTYRGFKLIHLVTACVNWGFESRLAIRVARLAVETGFHPLYEIEGGRRYRITHEPAFAPLEEFTGLQRRFQGVDLALLGRDAAERGEDLRYKAAREWPAAKLSSLG